MMKGDFLLQLGIQSRPRKAVDAINLHFTTRKLCLLLCLTRKKNQRFLQTKKMVQKTVQSLQKQIFLSILLGLDSDPQNFRLKLFLPRLIASAKSREPAKKGLSAKNYGNRLKSYVR